MKNYLAIFTGSPTSPSAKKWDALDEASRKKVEADGMQAWQAWMQKNAPVIVQMGSPLGKTKRIDIEGIQDIKNQMSAYCVVKADSHDGAAKLFLKHPHFAIFPGDGVEVMECLPIPGM